MTVTKGVDIHRLGAKKAPKAVWLLDCKAIQRMQFSSDANKSIANRNKAGSDPTSPAVKPSLFRRFAQSTAEAVGSPWAFVAAVVVTLVWALSGPYYRYSDTWQLVINTGTTIATFLIVFLIQHTQNRDARVIHLKLDELIRAVEKARNELVYMEDLNDEELEKLQGEFQKLQTHSRKNGNKLSPPKTVAELTNSD